MPKVKLGDIAKERREVYNGDKSSCPVVGLEHLTPGEIRLSDWDVGGNNTFSKAFFAGDVLFGRRRAYLKKAAQATVDGVCSGDITVIQARTDRVSPELLPFIIQNDAFFKFAVENSAGSLSPRVKWEHLANYEIGLPPMNEQRKLASLLWAAYELKESYERLLLASDEMAKSRFIEMFGKRQYPQSALIELIEPDAGLSYGIVQPGDDGTGDMGVLRPVDLIDGRISTSAIKYVNRSIGDGYKRTELNGKEILISVRGTTGITAITDSRFAGMNVTRGIAVIRFDEKKVNAIFLNAAINERTSQAFIQEHTRGATLKQINLADLRRLPIFLPPLALQKEFAAFIEQLDKSKVELQKSIACTDAMIKSLLSEAMGE